MKKSHQIRKLTLKKDTLKQLNNPTLMYVAGGRTGHDSCSCDIVSDCTVNCTWPCYV
jgi:hypothetical protein